MTLPPTDSYRSWIIAQRPPRTTALDPFKPHGFFLEDELAASGRVVSCGTILLTNKECPWRCLMCDLWKNTLTETVPLGAIPRQIEFALAQLEGRARHSVRAADCQTQLGAQGTDAPYLPPDQIKLYNSGSFFDFAAIPFADYPAIARTISFAKHVVVESHPRLIGERALHLRDLLSGSLEVAMGLETIHPQVLPRLNKNFNLEHFSRAAEFLRKEGIAMRAFILVKPPFLNDSEGIEWAVKSAAFAFDCGATVVSLIPTRGGNGAMEQLHLTGDFNPPKLATLERAMEQTLAARVASASLADVEPGFQPGGKKLTNKYASVNFKRLPSADVLSGRQDATLYGRQGCPPLQLQAARVFADTWDLESFSRCPACFGKRRQRLHAMNLSQEILPEIVCSNCNEE